MITQPTRIQNFRQLKAWQRSHELVVAVFEEVKKLDRYDPLRNQIERSAISITSNIVEGFGRQSLQDKKHFYTVARGSAYELQNQLILARDTHKITEHAYTELDNLSLNSVKLLHGLLRSLVEATS